MRDTVSFAKTTELFSFLNSRISLKIDRKQIRSEPDPCRIPLDKYICWEDASEKGTESWLYCMVGSRHMSITFEVKTRRLFVKLKTRLLSLNVWIIWKVRNILVQHWMISKEEKNSYRMTQLQWYVNPWFYNMRSKNKWIDLVC